MVNIHVGTDDIGSYNADMESLNAFIKKMRDGGHEVTGAGRGDSAIQNHMRSSSNKCDIMIQLAGGMCPGTFGDFSWGCRGGKDCNPGYYHADKFAILIDTRVWHNYAKYDPKKYKLPESAWDDSFSQGKIDKSKMMGRTWQEISNDKTNFPRCAGFAEGKGGAEIADAFLKVLNGGSSTTDATKQQNAGGSIIDYIKQVCSDLDPYGVELEMVGDTVKIHKSRLNTAKLLNEARVITNSISYTDYQSNTPNVNGSAEDKYLVNRFGKIPLEATVQGDEAQVLQIAQRGRGHSLDLKCILSKDYQAGSWVKLNIPTMNIEDRLYYVSKLSYDDELTCTLTLERGPPSLYVEVMEMAEETTEEGSEESTEEDSGDDA